MTHTKQSPENPGRFRDLVVRKKVKVKQDGKTVDYSDAWSTMEKYLKELEDDGDLTR